MKSQIVVALIVVLLGAAAFAGFYLSRPTGQGGPGTGQGSGGTGQGSAPYISDISLENFVYDEDYEPYMRLKIRGEVDLRGYTTINGVYGYWWGRIVVKLPNGDEALLFEPGDYVNAFTQFTTLSGEKLVDVWLRRVGGNPMQLEGTYTVTVELIGPYGNRVTLFSENFDLRMSFTATISPTVWRSWDENITIQITNTGDLPISLSGIAMQRTGVEVTIGSIVLPPAPEERLIMPGETKMLSGRPEMHGDFQKDLAGETCSIDFLFSVSGASRSFRITQTVTFPS